LLHLFGDLFELKSKCFSVAVKMGSLFPKGCKDDSILIFGRQF